MSSLPSLSSLSMSFLPSLSMSSLSSLSFMSSTQATAAVEDVWAARNDPGLWKRLDSAYKTFAANKPSPSVSQVLLSIL